MTLNNIFKRKIAEIVNNFYLNESDKIREIISINKEYGINSKNFVITIHTEEGIKKRVFKIKSNYNHKVINKIKINDILFNREIKVPKIFKTKMEKLFGIDNSDLFILLKYYPGEDFSGGLEEIFSAGENLALLNNELDKIDLTIKRNSDYANLSLEELKIIKELGNVQNSFEAKVLELCDKLPYMYDNINSRIKNHKNKKQLVYLDYHPKNLIYKDNKVKVILDFDSFVSASKLQSIAFGYDRFSPNIKKGKKFIKGYLKNDSSIKDKIMLLPFFIQQEALCRINYILRNHFFYNNSKWDFELDKHLAIIKRANNMKL